MDSQWTCVMCFLSISCHQKLFHTVGIQRTCGMGMIQSKLIHGGTVLLGCTVFRLHSSFFNSSHAQRDKVSLAQWTNTEAGIWHQPLSTFHEKQAKFLWKELHYKRILQLSSNLNQLNQKIQSLFYWVEIKQIPGQSALKPWILNELFLCASLASLVISNFSTQWAFKELALWEWFSPLTYMGCWAEGLT